MFALDTHRSKVPTKILPEVSSSQSLAEEDIYRRIGDAEFSGP